MTGYSGTPLAKKLGIREGFALAILDAPKGFADVLRASGMDESVTPKTSLRGKGAFDVIVCFVTEAADLEAKFEALKGRLSMNTGAGVWIAWPKKASGERTDVTEDVVRDIALAHGLVDNKVCAIDEVWSGLRVVRRRGQS